MKKKIISYSFFYILLCFILIIFLNQNTINQSKINVDVPKCNKLNYEQSLKLHPNNFQSANIEIKIKDNREWQRLLLEEEVLAKSLQIKYDSEYKFYSNRKRIDAKIFINFNNDEPLCFLNAKIRPHGDLKDHRSENSLPSLNVNLEDGHFFGIVKFILLKPVTRNFDNEIIATQIFKDLKFISPRTANFYVTNNGKLEKFIFQERAVKELIESNNKLENPIFKGDERFTFSDRQKFKYERSVFNHHFRPANENFILQGESQKSITETGLSILNELVLFYQADVDEDDVFDIYEAAVKANYKKNFENFNVYDALLLSMDASHGFPPGNRKIYFDSTSKKFLPIYYDGNANILNEKNLVRKKTILSGDKIALKFKNPKTYYGGMFYGKVQSSAINGAKEALLLIKTIDKNKFNQKIKSYGVNLSSKQIDDLFLTIENNLSFLKDLKDDKIIQSMKSGKDLIYVKDEKIFKKIFNNKKKQDEVKRLLVYYGNEKEKFITCDIFNKNCNEVEIPNNKIKDLISQNMIDEKDNKLIFLGKNNKERIFDGWFGKQQISDFNKFKEFNYENFKIKKIGSINFELNKEQKKIKINKYGVDGKLIIYDGNLDNWSITFNDDFNLLNENISRRDKNGLTGCVTFIDLFVNNLSLDSSNAKCEDSLNFIRTSGSIKNLKISNSLHDGLDSDFSRLKFENIHIYNSGNDCADFSFGEYIIEKADISYCGDKAISVGELSEAEFFNLDISNVNSGIASKDYAIVAVDNLSANSLKYCLQAYNKKQEFSGGFIKVNNLKCSSYKELLDSDKYSNIQILNQSAKKNNLFLRKTNL